MKISALILTLNEEEMIKDCLSKLSFADEIIILDQNSQDGTLQIAKKYTDKIFFTADYDFSENRNLLARLSRGEWLFYLDADERIDDKLIKEVKEAIEDSKFSAYYFPRKNMILGRFLKHAGFWPDYVPRLFKKDKLISWYGRVHESPKIKGDFGYIKSPIVHLTARSFGQMLAKTIKWAKIEAELFYKDGYPQVTILRIIKSMIFEFVNRYVLKRGFLDGQIGFIQSVYQALHQAVILTYIWEMQNDTRKNLGGL